VLLGEAPFGKLHLTPGGHGCPDGTYPRGDATDRYDQREERVHFEGPPVP
jgi:hypothetical protein